MARLAPLVDRTAMESDDVALRIMQGAAQDLAALAGSVRAQLWAGGGAVEVAYIGGVFGSQLVLERFRILMEMADGVHCGPPLHGPAEGALLEAYREAGVRVKSLRSR